MCMVPKVLAVVTLPLLMAGCVLDLNKAVQAFSVKRRNFGRQGIYPLPHIHL